MNIFYLFFSLQEQYDPAFEKEVQNSQVVSLTEVKSGRLTQGVKYKIVYHTKDVFKRTAKALGLMDDFKVKNTHLVFNYDINYIAFHNVDDSLRDSADCH